MVHLLKKNLLVSLFLLGVVIFSGCNDTSSDQVASKGSPAKNPSTADTSSENQTAIKQEESAEPVELVFYALSVLSGTDEEKAEQYTSFVQEKHPHISFKFINAQGDQAIDKYILTNEPMDVVFGSFSVFVSHKDKNILGDMTPLVKKHGFDLETIEQPYVDLIHEFDDGKLPLLPIYDLRLGLYYNKELFDKFAVPYPADGLTWNEMLEVAKQLTRSDDGVVYRGFATGSAGGGIPVNQYSLAVYDSDTGKASINTEQWKRYFDAVIPFFTLPGYEPDSEVMAYGNQLKMFEEGTAAMVLAFNSYGAFNLPALDLDWDVVSLPEMDDLRGVGAQPYPVYIGLSSTTKHPDEAFLAISALLSLEAQIARSSQFGIFSPLKNPDAKAAFGQATMWEGKNIAAFTNQVPAPPAPFVRGEYKRIGESMLNAAFMSVVMGEKDINTALREAEELANAEIEALKLK